MPSKLEELKKLLKRASDEKKLLESAVSNMENFIASNFLPNWALDSLIELFNRDAYEELNDRFFQTIAFGTGGMRGRTIGKVSASSELGKQSPQGTPEHAAVGVNNMNDFTVLRATMGLFNYCKKWTLSQGKGEVPRLVIAYDVRHFSKRFCEISATLWKKCGGEVFIFDTPRSTPQLSFTVRKLKATAGVVITASHNPSHDNGYKIYFNDGAQATSPHAEGIVKEVGEVSFAEIAKFLETDLSGVEFVSNSAEQAYISAIEESVVDKEILSKHAPKLVFTAVHGTGAALCPDIMRHFGLSPEFVEEQMNMDSRFPTVKQPNPEYAETLQMALNKAENCGADCLMATDPDADRMGVAIRAKDGRMRLITGNMIGSMLAEYRATRMKELGILTNPEKCALIKSFVTTPLQDRIAASHGLKCVNTLTGFKWIGGRLTKYEDALEKALGKDCKNLPYLEKAKMMQEHSTFFVFGGEESYGYLGTDSVRDKDANAAVIMFSELMAYLKSVGKTADEYLDEIYLKNGYFLEELKSIYREGASGAAAIKTFLKKLDESPLDEVAGFKVSKAVNFSRDEIYDADGVRIPEEKFFFYTLENGYSFAVRGSGTEPKIKFYAFAKEEPKTPSELENAKISARQTLDKVLDDIEKKFDQHSK